MKVGFKGRHRRSKHGLGVYRRSSVSWVVRFVHRSPDHGRDPHGRGYRPKTVYYRVFSTLEAAQQASVEYQLERERMHRGRQKGRDKSE